ncbi:ATP-binding protein [Caldimonas brevitalea]|uniref:histidine kinase n=1 Tax=Caldimonas brevitalea TaxID=413882 RepID=A0A0G3BSI5_9BURK|nr:ATP-binding protein [Caldimonas brevitalea]AKJ30341.1 sensory box histidine kinase [Caldimonas brevitalea]
MDFLSRLLHSRCAPSGGSRNMGPAAPLFGGAAVLCCALAAGVLGWPWLALVLAGLGALPCIAVGRGVALRQVERRRGSLQRARRRLAARREAHHRLERQCDALAQRVEEQQRMLDHSVDARRHLRQLEMQAEVIERTHDAVAVLDEQGRVLRWNQGATRVFARTPEAMLGRPFEDLFEDGDRLALHDLLTQGSRAAADGGAAELEVRALTQQGDALWVLLSVSRLAAGEAGGDLLLVYGLDITARRLAEDTLRRTLERANAHSTRLLGLSRASVEISRRLGQPDLVQRIADDARHLIAAHQCVIRVSGGDGGAPAGQAHSYSSKYAAYRQRAAAPGVPPLHAMVLQHASPMLLTQEQLERHPRWRRVDDPGAGEPPLRGWLAVPMFGRDGQPVGVLQLSDKYEGDFDADDLAVATQLALLAAAAIESDALYRRAALAERELRQRQPARAPATAVVADTGHTAVTPVSGTGAARAPAREVERLAVLAVGELEEPLRKIQGFAQRLLQRQAGRLDDEGREDLGRVGQATRRLRARLQDLLAYSRVLGGEPNWRSVDLYQLVGEVQRDLAPALQRGGAVVTVSPLPVVEGDAARLQQLLHHLLDNAVKFVVPGQAPRVTISARSLVAPLPEGGALQPQVEIEVRDEGIGVDAQQAERIFRPFERLHPRSRYEGSGLGLAVVRSIVEQHRGSVSLWPHDGAGSRFVVRLPLRQTTEATVDPSGDGLPAPVVACVPAGQDAA